MKKRTKKKTVFSVETILQRFKDENIPIDESSVEKIADEFKNRLYLPPDFDEIIKMLKKEMAQYVDVGLDPMYLVKRFVQYCEKVDMLEVARKVNKNETTMMAEISGSLLADKENSIKKRNSLRATVGLFRRGADEDRQKKILGDSKLLLEERGVKISDRGSNKLDSLLSPSKRSFTTEGGRKRFIEMVVQSFNLGEGGALSEDQVDSIYNACKDAISYGYDVSKFTKFYFDSNVKTMSDALSLVKLGFIRNVYAKRGISISQKSAKIILSMGSEAAIQLDRIMEEEKKKAGLEMFPVDSIVKEYKKAQGLIRYYASKGFDISLFNAMKMSKMSAKSIGKMLAVLQKKINSIAEDPVLLNNAITFRLKYMDVLSRFNFHPLNEKQNEVQEELESLGLSDLENLESVFDAVTSLSSEEQSYEILRAINRLYLEREFLESNFALEPEHAEKMSNLDLEDLNKLKKVFHEQRDTKVDEDTLIEIIEHNIDDLAEQSENKKGFKK